MSAQEFKVGQRIIGPDYTRLPVGAEVNNVWRKVAPNDWRNANFPDNPHTDDDLHNPRPLTHLPDELTDWERELLAEVDAEDKDDLYVEPEPLKEGQDVLARVTEALREYEEQHPAMFDSEGETVRCFGGWLSDRGINLIGPSQATPNRGPETAPEPEDTDDVEPEPLKEGDWALAWVRISRATPDRDGDLGIGTPGVADGTEDYAFIRPDAIVRPDAGQVPPWVKPARCTSLRRGGEALWRCVQDEGHDDEHASSGFFWATADEDGRITKGGAS